MRNAKRIVALLLCLTLLVSAMAIFVSAAETEPETEAPQSTSVEPNYSIDYEITDSKVQELVTNGASFSAPYSSDPEGIYAIVSTEEGKFLYVDKAVENWRAYTEIGLDSAVKAGEYKLLQFDMALTGTSESDGQPYYANFLVGGGYISTRFSAALNGSKNGEFGRVTAVFYLNDEGTLAVEYYYNGVYTAGGLSDSPTQTSIRVIASAKNTQVYLSNVTLQTTTEHPAVNNALKAEYNTTAVQFPAIATVDGVDYHSVAALNAELAKAHSVPANVEFLHDYTATPWATGEKVAVNCNATINTNGFVTADDLDLANVDYTVDGNVITASVPKYTITNPSETSDFETVTKSGYDSENNQFSTSVTLDGWGKIVTTDAGDKFLSLYTGESTATNRTDIYFKSGKREISNYPVALVQFEAARTGTVASKGISAFAGTSTSAAGFKLNGTVLNFDALNNYAIGETVQISIVYYYTQDESGSVLYATSFLNGVKKDTVSIKTPLDAETMANCMWVGIRIDWKTGSNLLLDNFYTNAFTSTDVLNADKSIKDEYSQFTKAEFKSLSEQLPVIATVNGVEYKTVADINAELAKTHSVPAEVEFLHDYTATPWYTGKIAVNCSAHITTNSFVTADDFDLTAVKYAVDGNTIYTHVTNDVTSVIISQSHAAGLLKSPVTGAENIGFSGTIYSNHKDYILAKDSGTSQYLSISNAEVASNCYVDILRESNSPYNFSTEYRYMVLQLDAAYTSKDIPSGNFQPNFYTGGTNIPTSFTYAKLFAGIEPFETVQFTFIFSYDDVAKRAYCYAYRNGDFTNALANTSITHDLMTTTTGLSQCYFRGLRNYYYDANSLAIDNVYVVSMTDNPLENATLKDNYNQFVSNEYTKLTLPNVALVDGVAVGYDGIDAALADGGNHTVELLHKPLRTLTVQSNATVIAYDYTGRVVAGNGYLLEEDNGIITVAPDDRRTNIKITLDGQTIATIEDALYSNSHEEIIRNYSLDNALHKNSVYYKDGKYYELVWDFSTKPEYAEEITYEATLKPAVILVVDIINNVVVSDRLTYTDGVLTGGLFNDVNETVVYFNDNITSTANTSALQFANTEWYMNGYTYTWHMASDDVTNHGISLMNGAQFVINNGKFDIEYGSSFFIIPNAHVRSTSLTLNDVTINTNTLIADVRSGSVNLNNCVINRGNFMIGARTSTDTYINFTDCTIKSSVSTGSYIAYHNNDGWNDYGVKSDKLPNVDRHVTFTNCKFHLLSGAITSMPAETFAVDIPEGASNNRKVTFVNSEVYSQTAISAADGKLIFGEGVKYSIVNGTNNVTAAEGVKLGVKTNDIGFDYVATANYTEKTWESGLVELWEVGATPVASDPADKATEGTAGGYTLTANLTLHANIFFNIYADDVKTVTINGVPAIVGEDGKYSYELLPATAFGDIYVVITFNDDSVYTRTTSLMEYVGKSATTNASNTALVQLYSNMLQYVLKVQDYEYIAFAQADAMAFLKNHAATSVAVENATMSGNIGDYLVSAYFQLDGDVKLVLTLKDGVTVNAVTVGGEAVATVVVDGKLYVEIPAYLLTETVTITTANGAVEYSLGAYAQSEEIAGTRAGDAALALYSYAAAAKAYEAQYLAN